MDKQLNDSRSVKDSRAYNDIELMQNSFSHRSKGSQGKNQYDMDDGIYSTLKLDQELGGIPPSRNRRMNRGADGKFESANYNDMIGGM